MHFGLSKHKETDTIRKKYEFYKDPEFLEISIRANQLFLIFVLT